MKLAGTGLKLGEFFNFCTKVWKFAEDFYDSGQIRINAQGSKLLSFVITHLSAYMSEKYAHLLMKPLNKSINVSENILYHLLSS